MGDIIFLQRDYQKAASRSTHAAIEVVQYWPRGQTLARAVREYAWLCREVIETSNPPEQHPLCKERQRESG